MICIGDDEIWFHDNENQPRAILEPVSENPNPAEALSHNASFRSALDDDEFARKAYQHLMHADFVRGDEKWTFESQREAAYYIALLRDRGESYLDYFLNREQDSIKPDPAVRDRLNEIVATAGWHIKSDEEYKQDAHKAEVARNHILRAIRRMEARDPDSWKSVAFRLRSIYRRRGEKRPPINHQNPFKKPGPIKRKLVTREGWKRILRRINNREVGHVWIGEQGLRFRIDVLRKTGRISDEEHAALVDRLRRAWPF